MRVPKLWIDIGSAVFGNRFFELHPGAFDTNVYPLDLEFTLADESRYYSPKDSNGIPLHSYQSVGEQYNATRIAAYALAHFNRVVTAGSEKSRDLFLRVASWFMESDDGLWRYHFDWGDLCAPWISCMSQGEGISVLTRAFALTNDERYLLQAQKAIQPFALPIEQGGVRSQLPEGGDFLEEYPSQVSKHTLNGFLYALIGILDLVRFFPSAQEATNFAALKTTLVKNWQLFDLGYWSSYDLHKTKKGLRNPTTVSYHRLHITLMRYLAVKLGSCQLRSCHQQWTKYYHSLPNRLRALAAKVRYREAVPALR